MKILIISGFLGAGKTTFIKELSRRTNREIAILENELGAQNIDANRIAGDSKENSYQNEDNKINIWEMTEGCICCSSKNDLSLSVLTISNSVDPEFLVIEPTGVGMLSNIITNLSKVVYEHISIGSPITVVDGNAWQTTARDCPDLFFDQLKNARTVVVSKLEQKDYIERNTVSDALSKENPFANITTVPYCEKPDEWWNELLEMDFDGKIKASEDISESFETFSLREASISSPADLVIFLENIIKGHYGDIVRAKGCVKTNIERLRFDVAGGNYVISGTDDNEQDQVVFIGKNIKRQEIRPILLSSSDAVRIIRRSGRRSRI